MCVDIYYKTHNSLFIVVLKPAKQLIEAKGWRSVIIGWTVHVMSSPRRHTVTGVDLPLNTCIHEAWKSHKVHLRWRSQRRRWWCNCCEVDNCAQRSTACCRCETFLSADKGGNFTDATTIHINVLSQKEERKGQEFLKHLQDSPVFPVTRPKASAGTPLYILFRLLQTTCIMKWGSMSLQ